MREDQVSYNPMSQQGSWVWSDPRKALHKGSTITFHMREDEISYNPMSQQGSWIWSDPRKALHKGIDNHFSYEGGSNKL